MIHIHENSATIFLNKIHNQKIFSMLNYVYQAILKLGLNYSRLYNYPISKIQLFLGTFRLYDTILNDNEEVQDCSMP